MNNTFKNFEKSVKYGTSKSLHNYAFQICRVNVSAVILKHAMAYRVFISVGVAIHI